MFDENPFKHERFDAACRAFALVNNMAATASEAGLNPQMLRNKLNPDQPHRLTCADLIVLTQQTRDTRLIDGLLSQLDYLPSVPRAVPRERGSASMPVRALIASADVGAIAGHAVSDKPLTRERRNAIIDCANDAIRNLSLIVMAVECRFQQTGPMIAAAAYMFTACSSIPGIT